MTHLTLATIIRMRVPLAPREAAALTLAVAARWDRERAHDATSNLPDVSAIRLHSTGEVSFRERASRAGGGVTLSELLGQLLGIDEPSAPRQPVPGGLLITIAGQLGQMELPSRTEDGFRSALARFADEDPTVLRRVFRRAARAARAARHRDQPVRAAHLPDRRRQPRVVADLRRDIRGLEQRVYEAGEHQGDADRNTAIGHIARLVTWTGVAVVLSVCTVTLLLAPRRGHPVAERSAASSPAVPAVRDHVEPAIEMVSVATPAATTGRLAPVPAKKSTAVRRAPVRRAQPPAPQPRQTRAVAFAGGTRSIGWLTSRP